MGRAGVIAWAAAATSTVGLLLMSVVDGDRPFLVRLLPLLLCVSGLVTFFAVASTIPGEGGDVGGNGYGGYGPVGAL